VEASDVTGLSGRRNPERGNSLVLAMLVMSALGVLAMLTVMTVRSAMQSTSNDRFHTVAIYAAESGGAAAMVFLRANADPTTKWSAFVDPVPSGTQPVETARFESGILGNGALPGATGNPFAAGMNAYYEVSIYNDRGDTGLVAGDDNNAHIIIRSVGHGPDGAMAIIEWEVTTEPIVTSTPCRVYAQESQAEDNSGTNTCIGTIDTTQSATFIP
jgi:hypothetical protein